MSEGLGNNLVLIFKRRLPFLVSAVLVLFSYAPLNVVFWGSLRPAIGAACVYFWLQHRPDLFNLVSVFCLGLLDDVISTSPLGSNILEMLLMYVLVNNTSRLLNAKPFIVLWYGFALLLLLTMFVRYLVVSIYYSHFLPPSLMFFSYMVTIAVYPLVSLLLAFVQNNLIQDDV